MVQASGLVMYPTPAAYTHHPAGNGSAFSPFYPYGAPPAAASSSRAPENRDVFAAWEGGIYGTGAWRCDARGENGLVAFELTPAIEVVWSNRRRRRVPRVSARELGGVERGHGSGSTSAAQLVHHRQPVLRAARLGVPSRRSSRHQRPPRPAAGSVSRATRLCLGAGGAGDSWRCSRHAPAADGDASRAVRAPATPPLSPRQAALGSQIPGRRTPHLPTQPNDGWGDTHRFYNYGSPYGHYAAHYATQPERPALPVGWQALDDGMTGHVYYWHWASGVSQWEHPAAVVAASSTAAAAASN